MGRDGVDIGVLSDNQKNILKYITKDFMTPPQIADKDNKSLQAVHKTIKKLLVKGLLKQVGRGVYIKGGSYNNVNSDEYRLHALSYRINIIESSKKYIDLMKQRNKDELDGNTITMYKDNLLIYLNKDFFSSEPDAAYMKSLDYIHRFIIMLENNYGIILKKGKQYNLKQFRGEIAKTNDPYAEQCNINKDKIRIYDEDGVLRLLVDNSYDLNELETVSNDYHLDDMNKIKDKWLDLIKTDLKLSDVENHLKVLQHNNLVTNEKFDKMFQLIEQIIKNR